MNFTDSLYGRENTIQTYSSLYRKHIEPVITSKQCLNWSETDTLKLIKSWENKHLARNTQSTLVRLLAKYVKFNGGPEINSSKLIRLLSRQEQVKDMLVLNEAQASALMQTCAAVEPKFYPILLLALHGGLRRGEVYGLILEDLDFIKMQIKVSKSYNGPTKNGKTRHVPMSKELFAVLSKWAFSKNLNNKLFKLENPNPKLRRLCRLAGVPIINFHALRHTFATLALEAGTSPRKVQKWLGHSSLTTTLNIYWGVINEADDKLDFLPGGNNV